MLQGLLGFDRYLYLFSIYIIHTLRWNKKERDFLHFLQMIPEEGTILDVGANIGIMSVWFGKKRPKAEIIAFEPMPQNVKALKKVLHHFNIQNVKVVEKALGNSNGEVEMVMPVLDDVKMQGLSHVVHESITDFNDGKSVKTPITRLDDCVELNGKGNKLKAIKLDVENFEYFVLAGAKKLIQRNRPIIYTELWENENRYKCFELMQAENYQIMVLQNGKLVQFEQGKHRTQNFFFVP